MSDWDDQQAELADTVMEAFGSHEITLTRKNPGSLNTTTLVRGGVHVTIAGIQAQRSDIRLIDGMSQVDYTIRSTSVGGQCPAKGDSLVEGSTTRTIISGEPECGGHLFKLTCLDKAATR